MGGNTRVINFEDEGFTGNVSISMSLEKIILFDSNIEWYFVTKSQYNKGNPLQGFEIIFCGRCASGALSCKSVFYVTIFTRILMRIHVPSYGNLGCCYESLRPLILSPQKILENAFYWTLCRRFL